MTLRTRVQYRGKGLDLARTVASEHQIMRTRCCLAVGVVGKVRGSGCRKAMSFLYMIEREIERMVEWM